MSNQHRTLRRPRWLVAAICSRRAAEPIRGCFLHVLGESGVFSTIRYEAAYGESSLHRTFSPPPYLNLVADYVSATPLHSR